MIEAVKLDSFELVGNYVLLKLDRNYDYVEVNGPNGKTIELQLVDFTMNKSQLQAITGTIIKAPDELFFLDDIKSHKRGETIADDLYESVMRNSMPFDVDMSVIPGDKVAFDYKQALDGKKDGRVINTDQHGYCLLLRYHNLFCKIVDEQVIPINGWVLFKRDQQREVSDTGRIYVPETALKRYGENIGTVMIADSPVRDYLEKGYSESQMELNEGDRIVLQKQFGYRVAVDRFAGVLKDIECIRRRNIMGIFENGLN